MQLIFSGLIRGGIPFVILSGISLILNFQNKTLEARGTFYSALIIFIVGMSSIIYDVSQWSFVKQSVVHFALMLVTVYPILLFSGWFPLRTFKDGLVVLAFFLAVGLVLWSLFTILAKVFNW